ncbi:MAG: methyltransferase [Oscillospiraceae bacterium]|nr:methyltransferase [Oscillospiraceae bacterium]
MAIDYFSPDGPAFYSGRGFSIGTDAVLLYAFSRSVRGRSVADFGCGSGVIGILLALDDPARQITALDIQPEAVSAARDNAALNSLANRFQALEGDLREYRSLFSAGCFDLAVMNPPYYQKGSGKEATDSKTALARTELSCTLEDACLAARWSVRWGGRFCMVHKPERSAELQYVMHDCGLEPKRLRFVQSKVGTPPNLVLVESVRGAKPGITVEAPLILLNDDGSESPELRSIYRR